MWLALVFKNLKTFLHTKLVLFVFIVLSLMMCMIASLSVVGMVDAITPDPQEQKLYSTEYFHVDLTRDARYSEEEQRHFVQILDLEDKKFLYIGEDNEEAEKIRRETKHSTSELTYTESTNIAALKTYEELKQKILYVVNKCSEDLFEVSVGGTVEDNTFGKISYVSEGKAEAWLKKSTPEGQSTENTVQIVRNRYYDSPVQRLAPDDKMTLGSIEYRVLNIKERSKDSADISTGITVNAGAIDDTFTVRWVTYTFTTDLDQAGIARMNDAIQQSFGDLNPKIDVPEPPPLMEKQFNNMVYVLALIIILVVLLNVSRLYAYIMSTRRKALAVFSLCGAGKLKLFAVYMAEIVLMLLGSFLLGWAVFHFGLINLIAMLYPSFTEFFTPDIYLKIFGIYIGAGIIIMALNLIPVVRRSIIQLTKEGA